MTQHILQGILVVENSRYGIYYEIGVLVMESSRYKKRGGLIFKSKTGNLRGMTTGNMRKKHVNMRKKFRLSDEMA